MSDETENRIATLFREAIDQFPSEFKEAAKEWLDKRQKAIQDIKQFLAALQFI